MTTKLTNHQDVGSDIYFWDQEPTKYFYFNFLMLMMKEQQQA